ncbi:hypothetical protein [Micavibrio aeruginosavorus]|uniref:hypothetical protein n=1 Tax=Micavibrio aeruginosavorus TaxID=349221 RepID=UPI003F4AB463
MTNERDFKPAANPFAFMPGGSSYKLSTMSMNDTVLVQADKAVVPVTSVDDIIVQAVTAPGQTVLNASPTPCSGKRHFYNGLLGSTAASALTCGVLFTGLDLDFTGLALSFAGMMSVLNGGYSASQSKSGVFAAAGVGLLTSVFAAGLGYSAAGGIMIVASASATVSTALGAAAMPPDVKKRGASGGFKLAAGTALGCLAGMAMSAFTAVSTPVEPEMEYCAYHRNSTTEMSCASSTESLKRGMHLETRYFTRPKVSP